RHGLPSQDILLGVRVGHDPRVEHRLPVLPPPREVFYLVLSAQSSNSLFLRIPRLSGLSLPLRSSSHLALFFDDLNDALRRRSLSSSFPHPHIFAELFKGPGVPPLVISERHICSSRYFLARVNHLPVETVVPLRDISRDVTVWLQAFRYDEEVAHFC